MLLNKRFDKLSDAEAKRLIQEGVEYFLRERHKSQSFRNKKEKLTHEATFLAGAMSALQVCFGNPDDDHLTDIVPVIWVLNNMTGRSVLEEKNAPK